MRLFGAHLGFCFHFFTPNEVEKYFCTPNEVEKYFSTPFGVDLFLIYSQVAKTCEKCVKVVNKYSFCTQEKQNLEKVTAKHIASVNKFRRAQVS